MCFESQARKSKMGKIDYKITRGENKGSYIVNLAATGGSASHKTE